MYIYHTYFFRKEAPSIVAGQTKDLSKAFQNYAEPLIKNKPLSLVFLQDEVRPKMLSNITLNS